MLETLWRKPMETMVILKFLQNVPAITAGYHIARDNQTATMLVIDNRYNYFDRTTYPTATSTILISSDHPELTRALVPMLTRDEIRIFKLTKEADHNIIAQHFSLERQRALLSFTADHCLADGESIAIHQNSKLAPFELFAEQGHSQSWLAPLIDTGQAFTCTFEENGKALSACFAFQINESLWEIGGVYTLPEARRRRLAQRVVGTATAELLKANRLPRYQAEDTNIASIRLAESLGMRRCLTLTHFLSSTD